MPLNEPVIDRRTQMQLIDEVQARIAVHTPEWTNRLESDPGVTLIEVFAFLTENLLYRTNYLPERNRLKFLSLLGIPLYPGTSSQGIVTFTNERGSLKTPLNRDLEVRAGEIPFRTTIGVDVLPIETRFYTKREVENPPAELVEYYSQLYTSYLDSPSRGARPKLYDTLPFIPRGTNSVDLGRDTIDGSLWIALLTRASDKDRKEDIRKAIAGRILSLGIIPQLSDVSRRLVPGAILPEDNTAFLNYQIPDVRDGRLSTTLSERVPQYAPLPNNATGDVLARPGIVQITLPDADKLALWSNLDPLESGIGDFPPSLEDTALNNRLITWIRINAPASTRAQILWIGSNAATIQQRAHVVDERLPDGTGEPDQQVILARTPVVEDSVRLTVTTATQNDQPKVWTRIDDLFAAGAEVPVRLPPGAPPSLDLPTRVYQLDAQAGIIRFGDGTHGERPPFGATIRASYDYSVGRRGNVGPGEITGSPGLPAGIRVVNPMPTWGGTDPETVSDGEKQITRYVQHRDRLVTVEDFETITLRTPGVEIGRLDVLPAYNPELGSSESGDAPGAVTLMLIPKYDPVNPAAPMPDSRFLDAVCKYIDSRRLVTTEVFLRAPTYRRVWVSIGVSITPRQSSMQEVTEAVKAAVTAFFSPLPPPGVSAFDGQTPLFGFLPGDNGSRGWPLRKSVFRLEIATVASRVSGVMLVNNVMLYDETRNSYEEIPMAGLELPMLAGIAVGVGAPPVLSQIPGIEQSPAPQDPLATFAPVPVIPEECL